MNQTAIEKAIAENKAKFPTRSLEAQGIGVKANTVLTSIIAPDQLTAEEKEMIEKKKRLDEEYSTYYIRCRVCGGVTGTREGYLKENGEVKEFFTKSEAQAEADKLNKEMNHSNSTAYFSYKIEKAN